MEGESKIKEKSKEGEKKSQEMNFIHCVVMKMRKDRGGRRKAGR